MNKFINIQKFKLSLAFACAILFNITLHAQSVVTYSGQALSSGLVNSSLSSSRYNEPHGIASDANGNLFIADRLNNVIRKISANGVVSTYAGTGQAGSFDGPSAQATFNEPWAVAVDTLGNVYVADTKSYKIRKIDASGNVTTIAGTGIFGTTNGPGNVAKFGFTTGLAVTKDGSILYACDYNTHVIRKIENGNVSNLAGTVYLSGTNDGPGISASFNHPYAIHLLSNGDLLVTDEWNNTLRKLTPLGYTSTFAGNGMMGSADGGSLTASFNYPWGVTSDTLGNIFILDGYNFTIRKINPAGQVSTYAGNVGVVGSTDGTGSNAKFNNAAGICYNRADKSLYVADTKNHTIRKASFVSSINLNATINGANSATVCYGDTIAVTISPSGLTGYSVYDNGVLVGTSVNATVKVSGLTAGSHNLIGQAYDANGAVATSNNLSVNVSNAFVPQITYSGNTSFCAGDSLKLSATSGVSYVWSNGQTTRDIYVHTAGNYSVQVVNNNGCRGISTPVAISLLPSPDTTITSSKGATICPNDSTLLTVVGGVSWNWSCGVTTQSVKVPAGNYQVTITGANGCRATSANRIITNYNVSPITLSPSGSVTILQGDSILLTASGGSSYQWSNGQTGSSIYVNTQGSYSVSAINANGCNVSSSTVVVTAVSANNMVSVTGANAFCDGGSTVLTSYFTIGNQWYRNNTAISGQNQTTLTVTQQGYYQVKVNTGGGILVSDSIFIQVYPSAQLPVVNDTAVCKGNTLQLNVQGNDTYKWYNELTGGSIIASGNSFVQSNVLTPFSIYLDAVTVNGCSSTNREKIQVNVNPLPTVDFSQEVEMDNGNYVTTFSPSCSGADAYSWNFNGIDSSNLEIPEYIFTIDGVYTITLVATNTQTGCSNSIQKNVDIHVKTDLFIPTTFTPNNDGKNDLFRVRGSEVIVEDMLIYNQWGKAVYHADASNPTWDGSSNGEIVNNGTYVYKIKLTDAGIPKELKGSITVIK
ncbi:MAG: gliding motility-associated C-terminal domain-containing protein [Bacteroidota bacterium]